MKSRFCIQAVWPCPLLLLLSLALLASGRPYEGGKFRGRIAWSADGNHNDPDDWIASPVALAIFAEAGLKDRLVHFDYNCILPLTEPQWEKTHAESVLGAASRYGFDPRRFFDCRKDLDTAIASLVQAINESSADNPLYFVIAGPMEVPWRALAKSDPAQRRFVYCISHSRWNDGYATKYKFTVTKRSVIEQDVHWIQIPDQNERLSFGRYGQPSRPDEFAPYFWMRDSRDPKVRFLWERMIVSTRPDPSDAGMAWFVATGDEHCDPPKLRRLLEGHQLPTPVTARAEVRLEAENFRALENGSVEARNERAASHRLSVRVAEGKTSARLRTRFDEPFTRAISQYTVQIRYSDRKNEPARFTFLVNGHATAPTWESAGTGAWTTKQIPDVTVNIGDELRVDIHGSSGRLDYVQLKVREEGGAVAQ